jgi:predicted nucleic acid-binding protein
MAAASASAAASCARRALEAPLARTVRPAAQDFVDGCATVPVTALIADGAAALKARHRALSLPDAIALVLGDLLDADAVWTFDRRWSAVGFRVTSP